MKYEISHSIVCKNYVEQLLEQWGKELVIREQEQEVRVSIDRSKNISVLEICEMLCPIEEEVFKSRGAFLARGVDDIQRAMRYLNAPKWFVDSTYTAERIRQELRHGLEEIRERHKVPHEGQAIISFLLWQGYGLGRPLKRLRTGFFSMWYCLTDSSSRHVVPGFTGDLIDHPN